MNWKLIFFVCSAFLTSNVAIGQTLNVTYADAVYATGVNANTLLSLEKHVELTLNTVGLSTDTLIVELGLEPGQYDLLIRRFPLNLTGNFADGCSLTFDNSNTTIGLGNYTGMSSFYVRAYLASEGPNSAVTVNN